MIKKKKCFAVITIEVYISFKSTFYTSTIEPSKNPPKNKKIVGQILASVLLIKQIHTEF